MLPKYPSKIRVCHCKAHVNDPLVKNDLALTPHRMYELVQRGQPITEQTQVFDNDFIEGYSKLSFEVPHMYQRHADMISAWNTQQDSRKGILQFEQQAANFQEGV